MNPFVRIAYQGIVVASLTMILGTWLVDAPLPDTLAKLLAVANLWVFAHTRLLTQRDL